jgi:putative NADPH-quinone reductase
MRILLVHAHPVAESFGAAMRDAVLRGLAAHGHEVCVLDLYATGFEPRFSAEERLAYQDETRNQAHVEEHVALVKWAEGMVFVFPTWWYDMPAILKGWFDRCFPPGVAFTMHQGGGVIRPGLTHIRLLAAVTSCGSPWWFARYVGEPHRRVIMRGIGALCARRCRKIWLAHFKMDTSGRASLARYLARIERRFAAIR